MSRAFIINVILALNIICHALCSDVDTDQRVLSRRKRFLIFPTGASFSVAVCSTVGVWGNPQYSMFSWGINYGFAYNLPTNATYYQHPPSDTLNNFPFLDLFPFRDLSPEDDDPTTTTTTTTTTEAAPETEAPPDSHESITFIKPNSTDIEKRRNDWNFYNGISTFQEAAPVYYHRPINNNAFMSSNKRISSNIYPVYPVYYPPKIETKPMMQRRYRRDLYKSIETVLNRMGYDGRDCILRALCETPQIIHNIEKRSMVQELIKSVFSLPKSKVLSFEPSHSDLIVYDEAHRRGRRMTDESCAKRFARCPMSLIELAMGKFSMSSMAQMNFM